MLPKFAALLAGLESMVPGMQARAPVLDEAAAFPERDMADLVDTGLLRATMPVTAGGLGLGVAPEMAAGTLAVLRCLGRGNLALGRLFEAHVNAVRLATRFGDAALLGRIGEGGPAGLWVTDPPGGGLTIADGVVHGAKQFCSGAGHVAHAVVTATDTSGQVRLVYLALGEGTVATRLPSSLAGMRAASTGQVAFHGAPATVFGEPGDYLREPDFSCGAWRTSAATLGGLDALVEQCRLQLRARGRAGDPHQQARFGQALMAAETARLWLAEAAHRAEAADAGADAVAYVGLARLAVEQACLDTIALVQRSLGVAAMQRGNPVERLCRDLATYLRQPAADMVLTEAAALHLEKP